MTSEAALTARVLTGFALAFVVGFERKLRGSPAGDRTFALVGTGTAALTGVSFEPSPQAVAGAVTGIGFIGAGVVVGSGHLLVGVITTGPVVLTLELRSRQA